jgi:hypothetical protein
MQSSTPACLIDDIHISARKVMVHQLVLIVGISTLRSNLFNPFNVAEPINQGFLRLSTLITRAHGYQILQSPEATPHGIDQVVHMNHTVKMRLWSNRRWWRHSRIGVSAVFGGGVFSATIGIIDIVDEACEHD